MDIQEILRREQFRKLMAMAVILFLILGAWAFFLQNVSLNPEFLTLAGFIGGCVLLFTLIDIKIGIIFLIFSIALSPEMKIGDAGNIRLEDFIAPILIFSWVTRSTHERENFVYTSLKGPLVGFFTVSLVAVLWGYLLNTDYNLKVAAFEMGKLVEYYFFFLILANNLKTEDDVKLIITILILASLAGGFFGIRQHASKDWVEGPSGETANIWAGYYVFNLSLIVGLLFSNINFTVNLVLVIAAAILFWPFLYTFSRTAYIAFVAGMLTIGLFRRRRIVVIFILFFAMVGLMSNGEVTDRASTIADIGGPQSPSSFDARVQGWRGALNAFQFSPLFGIGPGSVGRDIDNEYIKDLADRGILGFLFFTWFLIKVLRMSFTTLNLCRDHPLFSGYLIGFLGGTIALMFHAFGAASFTTIRTMEIFMVSLGVMIAIHHIQTERLEKQRERELWAERSLRPMDQKITVSSPL